MNIWRCVKWLTDKEYREFKRESDKRYEKFKEKIELDNFRMTLAYGELMAFLTDICLPPSLFMSESDINYITSEELKMMKRGVKHFNPVYNKWHKKLVEVVDSLKKSYYERENRYADKEI